MPLQQASYWTKLCNLFIAKHKRHCPTFVAHHTNPAITKSRQLACRLFHAGALRYIQYRSPASQRRWFQHQAVAVAAVRAVLAAETLAVAAVVVAAAAVAVVGVWQQIGWKTSQNARPLQ